MRKLAFIGIALFVFVIGFSPIVSGQTILPLLGTEYGVGVRAIGMGGAFVSIANDYSASYWNPAGLGQIRRFELASSFNSSVFEDKSEYSGSSFSENIKSSNLSSVNFVYPVPTYRGSMVFAIGYNRITDFNNIFSIAGYASGVDLFTESIIDSVYYEDNNPNGEGSLNLWNFGGSMQMSENL